jgi:hypothetical protein
MRAEAALLFLIAAAATRAGDPSANAGDSIANAKKDFAAIKSSTAPSDSSPVLPTVDMKDLGPAPGAARPVSPALLSADGENSLDPSKKKEKEGTGNWLVDAMEKKSDKAQSSRGKDDLLRGDQDFPKDGERSGAQGERDTRSSADARGKAASREPAEAVYNPLGAFMGGWISARDHELLLPVAKGDTLIGGDLGRARAETLPGIGLGPSGAVAEGALPSLDAAAWSGSRAAPNPYIAALDVGPVSAIKSFAAPDLPAFAPYGPADAPRGMTSSGVDPRPLDTNRSFIPDFAKPNDDDKYFKQMKRF